MKNNMHDPRMNAQIKKRNLLVITVKAHGKFWALEVSLQSWRTAAATSNKQHENVETKTENKKKQNAYCG